MLAKINDNITAFVERPENQRLRAGTGVYSNHFRGGFMGEYKADAVWQKVSERGGIDVLWLGANPNAPDSLARILAGADDEHFEGYLKHLQQGWHCEANPDTGEPCAWEPLADLKQQGWAFYREAFQRVADPDAMIFANIVPWGSARMGPLVAGLRELDPELLKRVLRFSSEQVCAMVELLQPRFVFAPASFCNHQAVHASIDSPILGGPSYDFEHCSLKPGKRAMNFRFRTDDLLGTTVVHGAHPSALRPRSEHRQAYLDEFSQLLAAFAPRERDSR